MACLTIYKAEEPIQEANAWAAPIKRTSLNLENLIAGFFFFFFFFGGGWRSAAETEEGLDCYLKVVVNTQ